MSGLEADLAGVEALLRLPGGGYADDLLLAAIVRLDLLTVLAEAPATLDQLCVRNGIAYRPAEVLCTLLRATGLLEPGPVLRPTRLARACLVQGAPYDLRPYLAAGASRSSCLAQVELLRTGQPVARTRARPGTNQLRAAMLAPRLAEALAGAPACSVLEVAGSGAWATALAECGGDPAVTVLVDPWGCGDSLPPGHDLHLLPELLHARDDRQVRQLVSRCYRALVPGGWLVEVDAHLDPDRAGPLPVARFAAMVLSTTGGRCWSVSEVADLLAGVGFTGIQVRPVGLDRTAVLGRKPLSRGLRPPCPPETSPLSARGAPGSGADL